jgi:hypothetical protein
MPCHLADLLVVAFRSLGRPPLYRARAAPFSAMAGVSVTYRRSGSAVEEEEEEEPRAREHAGGLASPKKMFKRIAGNGKSE